MFCGDAGYVDARMTCLDCRDSWWGCPPETSSRLRLVSTLNRADDYNDCDGRPGGRLPRLSSPSWRGLTTESV